ncbi:hypothetical protein LAZ67_23000610 [Cordylochernes scorpioides]|uniref:Helitron helicase-like domain-containing protein n=1 Tax=Cordylochernes scorpioides TaxID=51811 RepID=A0ABY6LR43_9ARAC|nr:hypothetical protein LAZ67_23000610 [Cordylochernes scorpioides]
MPPKRKSIGRSTCLGRSKNISRASESVQQRDARLEDNRIQTAQARSNETVQQRKARLEDNRIQTAQARSNETVQQRKARLKDNRIQTAQARSNETVQQRKARLEDNRIQTAQDRLNETFQQRKARLEDIRIQTAQGRSNDSIYQRETRLGTNRKRNVRSRRTLHADLNLAAFHYDAEYDCILHPSVVIDKMDKLCKFCGKVKLPELHLPPEPLSTLISGATSQSKHFLRNIQKNNSCFQMTSFGATEIIWDNYMPTFKVQGQICHRQYIVDMYVKIVTERLLFIRLNQTKHRSENYIHLRDAIATDGNPNDLGKMIILPATFAGSPRHMHEYAQDAMTYVRVYGRPDLFITFTCNPRWEEIKELLLPGQSLSDRPDIIARVFNQILRALMHFIVGEVRLTKSS